MIGADPASLEALAASMSSAAKRLDRIRANTRAQLHSTQWHGVDADAIRRDWDSRYSQILAAAAHALNGAHTRLQNEARQQVEASRAGGATHAGHAPPTPPKKKGWRDYLGSAGRALQWATMVNPVTAPTMLLVHFAPDVLKKLNIERISIGDGDNHVVIAADGTVSFKLDAIKTEFSANEKDGSFTAQFEGLGIKHTKDDAWGIMASPGVNIGPLKLSAGLEATYNPHTGVVTPSGAFTVGVGHLAAIDGSIKEEWNPVTGDLRITSGWGGELAGARRESVAVEHNGEFESLKTTDSVNIGPVTYSNVHLQALQKDGAYVDSHVTTTAIGGALSLNTTYFSAQTEQMQFSTTTERTVTTAADGTQTIDEGTTMSGPRP